MKPLIMLTTNLSTWVKHSYKEVDSYNYGNSTKNTLMYLDIGDKLKVCRL